MTDRIEEIFRQVMDENCKDPLRRFAELVAADEREANKREWVGLSDAEVAIYGNQFSGIRLVREIEAVLNERNT